MPSLIEPRSYTVATAAERQRVVNGCGPESWKHEYVPQSILDVDIRPVCNIHDWMYEHGKNEDDRREADDVMLRNMKTLIRRRGGLIMPWRLFVAWWIHRALRRYGSRFFFTD